MSGGTMAPSRETTRPNETSHAVEMRGQWKHYLNRIAIFLLLSSMVAAGWPGGEVKRPRILGISHMALFVSDLQKSRWFYEDFLGYAEPYNLKRDDGSVRIAFIKINEDQYIELFTDSPKQEGQLNHIAFYTDSAEGLRANLASLGAKVPEKVGKGKIGNSNFNITDPNGHTVEIVQYEPDSWTRRAEGKYLPDTRISTHMAHQGVTVAALDASTKFYGGILGFQEFWRGSSSGKVLSWVNMRVPDGQDYLEFMLYSKPPDAREMGVKNHICLVTSDIEKAVASLKARPAAKSYTLPIEIKVGVNGKRQANLFDPDGTRIELMEPNTLDGKPVPPSAAPPPNAMR
jgi:catechol 2,3-dioxygenase-like lactoylglutathione lyase family enzyme